MLPSGKRAKNARSISLPSVWPDRENSRRYLPFGEKIVKIGPVDAEIALLIVKKYRKLEMRGKA